MRFRRVGRYTPGVMRCNCRRKRLIVEDDLSMLYSLETVQSCQIARLDHVRIKFPWPACMTGVERVVNIPSSKSSLRNLTSDFLLLTPAPAVGQDGGSRKRPRASRTNPHPHNHHAIRDSSFPRSPCPRSFTTQCRVGLLSTLLVRLMLKLTPHGFGRI